MAVKPNGYNIVDALDPEFQGADTDGPASGPFRRPHSRFFNLGVKAIDLLHPNSKPPSQNRESSNRDLLHFKFFFEGAGTDAPASGPSRIRLRL